MSVSLLKKTAALMGDLEDKPTSNKSASKGESSISRAVDAKAMNKAKLVKLSVKERKTRQMIDTIRKNREAASSRLSTNLGRVQRFRAKIDGYSKRIFSNDLVRKRIFKNQEKSFLALPSADKESDESVFTEEDFKRFEEEYNIKYTQRAKDRAEFQKQIK